MASLLQQRLGIRMHPGELLGDGVLRPVSCSASPLARQISESSLPIVRLIILNFAEDTANLSSPI
jgi:hypothetical protein